MVDKEKTHGKVLLIFAGERYWGGKSRFEFYHWPIVERVDLEEPKYWTAKNLGRLIVGAVYEFKTEADDLNSLFINTSKYAQSMSRTAERKHEGLICEWRARHDAAVADRLLASAEKKHKRANPVFECLTPVREAYRKAVGRQRAVILAQAVTYITRL